MGHRCEDRAVPAFCLFTSGSRPLGVALAAVAEVIEPGRLVRLPLCPRQVIGLGTFRGRPVPVISPVPRGEERDGIGAAILVLKTEHGLLGLSIDRRGVSVEEGSAFRRDEGPSTSGGLVAIGAVERDGTPHAILDPDRTWRELRAEIDRWYRGARGLDAAGEPGATRAG